MLDNYESKNNSLTEARKSSAPQIMAYVSGVASNVVDIFTALASSVYMLAEKDNLLRWKPAALPTTILKAFLAAKSLILPSLAC